MTDQSHLPPIASGESQEMQIRVLYIEDDPINRMVVRDMLSVVGINYAEAPDGPSGLIALEQGDYDLVLMDLRMPGMDGFEVTKAIRLRGDSKAQIPVVFVTADTGEGIEQGCLAAGAQEMLLKPVAMQPLLDAICRQVLTSNTSFCMI